MPRPRAPLWSTTWPRVPPAAELTQPPHPPRAQQHTSDPAPVPTALRSEAPRKQPRSTEQLGKGRTRGTFSQACKRLLSCTGAISSPVSDGSALSSRAALLSSHKSPLLHQGAVRRDPRVHKSNTLFVQQIPCTKGSPRPFSNPSGSIWHPQHTNVSAPPSHSPCHEGCPSPRRAQPAGSHGPLTSAQPKSLPGCIRPAVRSLPRLPPSALT